MSNKKRIVLGLLILLLLASDAVFIVYDWNYKRPMSSFAKIIERGDLNDLCLTIYYVNPKILSIPWDVKNLISGYQYKVVVTGSELEEQIDLLYQLSKVKLIPVIFKGKMDARIYYLLESTEKGKIIDVAMWDFNGYIHINGVAVKNDDDIFYRVIIPFLPEDAAKQLE